MRLLIKIKELILDILFPLLCLNCGAYLQISEKEDSVCATCFSKILIHTALFCPVCRARLPENKKICHKNAPFLLGAATNYDEPVKAIIHQFKYQSWGRLAGPLNKILSAYLKNLSLERASLKNFIIVSIPLHKNRQKERGFNQAELIGDLAAKQLGLPFYPGALVRVKETKSQAELKNYEERKNNLRGSFKVVPKSPLATGIPAFRPRDLPETIRGKNIILVDDVYTSGATITEAVKALKEKGARKIIALVVAKAR